MKKIVFILLILVLLLCACTPAGDPSIDGTTEPSTSQIIEPTGTETTFPGDTFMLVQHRTGATYDGIDTADMKDGALYAIENGRVSLIADDPTLWCFSDQHVYYCTETFPANVFQIDRNGENHKTAFQIKNYQYSPDRIVHIQFEEKLFVQLECYNAGKLLSSKIVAADAPDTPLVYTYKIDNFTYASSSTAFEDVAANISEEDLGATIYWTGDRNGKESGSYYSFIDRQECWFADTWEQVGFPKPTADGWADRKNGALYYVDIITEQWHLVFDGPVITCTNSYNVVFFVKEAEPTKIYAAPISDLTQHRVVYESTFGEISHTYTDRTVFWTDVLHFIEGNKRFVWLDLNKGETEVIMEQYYLATAFLVGYRYAAVPPLESWKDCQAVLFDGKLREDDPLDEHHLRIGIDIEIEEVS